MYISLCILTAARRRIRSIQYRLDALEELSVHGFALVLVVLRLAAPPMMLPTDGRFLATDQIGTGRLPQHDVNVRRGERLGLLLLALS